MMTIPVRYNFSWLVAENSSKTLNVQYIRIGHLSNTYSKQLQTWPLTAANSPLRRSTGLMLIIIAFLEVQNG